VTAVGYLRYAPSPNVAKHPEFFARARAEARVEEPLASLIRASK